MRSVGAAGSGEGLSSAPQYLRWLTRRLNPLDLVLGGLLLFFWLAVDCGSARDSQERAGQQSITLISADGVPIARRGVISAEPIEVDELPDLVYQAFLAIEDRRFYNHSGVDPIGIARAIWRNLAAGDVQEGGSTITQQLAKMAYLSNDRTFGRKLREFFIALWIEGLFTKDEILGSYLSRLYFGDNVYGLRAAARHYFSKEPEELSVPQAALLAGLVKAPSRLAPTSNLKGAQERTRTVLRAMARAGVLRHSEAESLPLPELRLQTSKTIPSGTYFADWLFRPLDEDEQELHGRRTIQTTLDSRLQRIASQVSQQASLVDAQVALVAMRPSGEVVAMVGPKLRRERLQPGHSGPAAAGFDVQAVHLSRSASIRPETREHRPRRSDQDWGMGSSECRRIVSRPDLAPPSLRFIEQCRCGPACRGSGAKEDHRHGARARRGEPP